MEFWSALAEKMIDMTATLIVTVAIHVPLLLSALIGNQEPFIPLQHVPIQVNGDMDSSQTTSAPDEHQEVATPRNADVASSLNKPLEFPEIEHWGACKPTSSVTLLHKSKSGGEIGLGFEKIDDQWNRLFIPLYGYRVSGYCIKYPSIWSVAPAGVERLSIFFNRRNGSVATPEFYIQAIASDVSLESSDELVYRYEESSSPLVEADERVLTEEISQIGDNRTLTLITTKGDVFYLRLFVKNENTAYMLKRSFSPTEYESHVYTDFLVIARDMISSLKPLDTE